MRHVVVFSVFLFFLSGCTKTPEKIITDKTELFEQFEDKFGRFYPDLKEQYEGSDLKQDLIESITLFEKLIEENPDNYDLKVIYGMLNSYAHNLDIVDSFEKAEEVLKKAISMDSYRWEAYFQFGNLYVHSPATIGQGLDILFKALKKGEDKINPKVYLYISEGLFFNALNFPQDGGAEPGKMGYYRLKKPGKYKFISDSLNYLRAYLHKNPYDGYAAELSIILNNHYWGNHIVHCDYGIEFTNSKFGYQFIIPQGWILFNDDYEKGLVVLNIPNTEPDGIVNSNAIAIAIDRNPAGGTVDSFIDDIKKRANMYTFGDKKTDIDIIYRLFQQPTRTRQTNHCLKNSQKI
ncbi:MAG: hypothetical protein PF637_14860 [Spirochaetes bacterium]|jgi:tetratricopeptide (TPR) repeat protein|nr:hypothetical protein [Spirochaetota bacterium]